MASIINVDKVRATGSTTDGITVSSAGLVQTPNDNKGLFYVGLNSTTTGIARNSLQVIQLDREDLDKDNYFNTSTYRYTPTVAGTYFFQGQITFGSVGAGDNIYCQTSVYKNGTNVGVTSVLSIQQGSGNDTSVFCSGYIDMNGTDYVDLRGYIYNYTDAASTNKFTGATTNNMTYLSGYRVL
jgi:hypothetical protein